MITIEKIIDEVNRLILLEYDYPIYIENMPEIINTASFGISLINSKSTAINKNTKLENIELLVTYLAQVDSNEPNISGKEKYRIIDKLKDIFGKKYMALDDRAVSVNAEYKEVNSKQGIYLRFEYYEEIFDNAEVNETINEINIKQEL